MVYLTSFTVFSGDIKKKSSEKKKKKKSSENDQLTGHFQSFFYLLFFRPLDPKSEKKNSRKSTNKKILALKGGFTTLSEMSKCHIVGNHVAA